METMSGFMLLTFWLCAGVNYIMLRNMSKRQKGLLLGVTLPPEADALPEVQAIVKQYRTRLGTLCLVCAALSVPLAFVQETATLPLRPLHCQSPWACGRCCRRWC